MLQPSFDLFLFYSLSLILKITPTLKVVVNSYEEPEILPHLEANKSACYCFLGEDMILQEQKQ